MDQAVAQRVLDHVITANGALQDAFLALTEAAETPEVHQAKHRIGMLIALIGTGLYKPLYHEHPDLCPDGLRFMLDRPPTAIDWPFGDSHTTST